MVYWKLFSRSGTRDQGTSNGIKNLLESGVTPRVLWEDCWSYIHEPNPVTFGRFRERFFPSPVVAVVATFPAFLAPERFPMVDTGL